MASTATPSVSARVAARAGIAWNDRSTMLAPVLGHSGVTAIYLRALQCVEPDHPWLDEVREQTLTSNSFAPLLAGLALRPPDAATAVQASLLDAFDRQLTALIGESLAERLLATVGARGEDTDHTPAPRPDQIAEQITLSALRAEADARLARCERDQALRASGQDDLTGVANRTRMVDRLKSAIALADRTDTPAAVLFIDLDRFKQINDDMGHRAGDEMLRAVATRLQDAVRKTDTVCRYGGDEFVVILTPMERRSEAAPAAARMLLAIEKARGADLDVPTLSASIGIGLYPEHGTDAESLLNRADRSMYRHKRDQHGQLPDAHQDNPNARPGPASLPRGDVPRIYAPQNALTGEG